MKWRKSDNATYIAKLREPPPELEAVRIARLNALVHSPPRGEKRRGRPDVATERTKCPAAEHFWQAYKAQKRIGLFACPRYLLTGHRLRSPWRQLLWTSDGSKRFSLRQQPLRNTRMAA